MLQQLSSRLLAFFQHAPALELALYLFLGSSFSLSSPTVSFCLSALFLILKKQALLCKKERYHALIYGTILIVLGGLYTQYFKPPLLISTPLSGNALLTITEKRSSTFFGKTSLYYKARLLLFQTDQQERYQHLNCTFYLKPQAAISSDYMYYVDHVTLSCSAQGSVRLKPSKETRWLSIKKSSSLVEWRYRQKLKAKEHLAIYFPEGAVVRFLSGMTLGFLDSKTLCYEFSRVGLQHLLTISGFHFALLALFFSLLLKPWMSKKYRAPLLLALLTAYVLYLGPAPSVSRAWIAIFFYLLGELLELKASAVNSIGLAALASFLEDPLCVLHMGFQLSYTATLGIVAFYTPCERWLRVLIPYRSIPVLVQMSLCEQLLYAILVFLRKAIALDAAVNMLTLPLIFYHFGNFPLFSFFYNLVIPPLITLSLFLVLVGFCCSFYAPLCALIHQFNQLYTEPILSLISCSPRGLDLFLYMPHLSPSLTSSLLCTIFLGMLYHCKPKELPYGIFKPNAAATRRA
jgi:competence protein ComEC